VRPFRQIHYQVPFDQTTKIGGRGTAKGAVEAAEIRDGVRRLARALG
jgi:hypothetical protein